MKKAFAGLLIAAIVSVVFAQATPGDNLLSVEALASAEESQFSTIDNKISGFWSADAWGEKDYIDMNTTNNSYPGRDAWDGTSDARITIKAAAGASGLYFYCEVEDNVWVDKVSGDMGWASDAVDLFFDNLSSDEIKSGGEQILVNPAYGWALTFSSQQYQVWMGSSALPETFMFNFYDDLYWTWSYNEVPFATAGDTYAGMKMEVVSVDATKKAQEWFIPWRWVGTDGVTDAELLAGGKRIGFSGGYNDLDGDGGEVNCLRWQNYDPFAASETNPSQAYDSWGNIELPPIVGVLTPKTSHVIGSAKVVSRGLYTLSGEKIAASALSQVKNHTMVIERSVLANGTIASRMVRTGR